MATTIRLHFAMLVLPASLWCQGASAVSPEEYNKRIKPILAKSCSGCHVFGGHAGGLRLDSFETVVAGGERGPAISLADPASSLLLKAVRYDDAKLKMPPRGRLPAEDIAAIEHWLKPIGEEKATSTAAVAPARPTESKKESARQLIQMAAVDPNGPPIDRRPIAAPPVEAAPMYPARPARPAVVASVSGSAPITPDQEHFFETKVRPVLARNCYSCHTRAASGGLRLDSHEALIKGGKDGAVVVPGKPEESMLISAIRYQSSLKMPPSGPLAAADVAVLEAWVKSGAAWPKSTALPVSKISAAEQTFWSFQRPQPPAVPQLASPWAFNDIDRFIWKKLTEKGLQPVADADRRTLIRRVSYDLTGLPPTPQEADAFVADKSPKAYENLVERLLASPAYGERWGRMWLDVVRYADTTGGGGDYPVPQLAKYRNYVIKAFNEDKPYDRFIHEQLAGDLLPAKTEGEQWNNIIATGYLAGSMRYLERNGHLPDAVDNIGYAFQGLTVACARCHDHKFDPIPTADYYAIYGVLASTRFPHAGNDAVRFQRDLIYRDPKVVQREDYQTFQAQMRPIQNAIEAVLKLPGTYDDLLPQLHARRMNMLVHAPEYESAFAVTEGDAHDVKVQHYGDPKDEGELVRRGFLQATAGKPLSPEVKGSGRLEPANWLPSAEHPLTARVMVNRIWLGHFGRGIVPTANDFGTRGLPPSNQELLDYLATRFVANGWSIKSLHRDILLSHAYRLSSVSTPANDAIDPENSYNWRQARRRLDAEQLRDSLLKVSGLLDPQPLEAHPFPPQSQWNYEEQNVFSPKQSDYETDKRTVYSMVQRTVRSQYFLLFDGANQNASTEQRTSSLTPLQALYFLNAPFPKRCSTSLASQILAPSDADSIRSAFQSVYTRPPTQVEMDRASTFLHKAREAYAAKGSGTTNHARDALADFVRAMFASNEFMFID